MPYQHRGGGEEEEEEEEGEGWWVCFHDNGRPKLETSTVQANLQTLKVSSASGFL